MCRSAKVSKRVDRKTARSKGFAFIEFEEKEVAKVAADAMQGYMMFGK